jgi:hypothetical protein
MVRLWNTTFCAGADCATTREEKIDKYEQVIMNDKIVFAKTSLENPHFRITVSFGTLGY